MTTEIRLLRDACNVEAGTLKGFFLGLAMHGLLCDFGMPLLHFFESRPVNLKIVQVLRKPVIIFSLQVSGSHLFYQG